jgi:uncharacterized membrane protein
MFELHFPVQFTHKHKVRNVNEIFEEQMTFGQRASDWIARTVGSWEFIVVQSSIFVLWAILNVTAWVSHWDPYPFILMNLVLSLQAAYTAPIIMMSQNRQEEKDRIEAHNDYQINQKAEEEIRIIIEHFEAQNLALSMIHKMMLDLQTHVVNNSASSRDSDDKKEEL